MSDFIFGSLANEELRLEQVRNRRRDVSHYQARTPRDPLPGEAITLELQVGPDYPCDQAWIYWTNDGTDPIGKNGRIIHGYVSPMERLGVSWDTGLWGYIAHFKGIIPGQQAETVVRYTIGAGTSDGEEIGADHSAIYACYVDDDPAPPWSRDAIIYQIFVDRFNPGKGKDWLSPKTPTGFYGGTIKGITEKLDYMSELGVNVLWLTPIFQSPSHHGYDSTDLFEIEPRLGNKADLRDLLDETHKRNMHILLDLVPNHVSNQHPAFQSAQTDQNSPYTKWYTFTHWPDKYSSFFGVRGLPQLNLREPSAKLHMLDAAAYWLEYGVDGYRVDYAVGPAPDFWADFRRVTRKSNPDCWTFGEVVEPPDSQLSFAGGLDGCLDFNLIEAFRKAFAYGEWKADRFANFISRHEAYFPESFSRPSFLDNHDMNRFLWAAGGDLQRLRLAALCQFTLSGAPIVYYGTEVGLTQLRDVRQDGRGSPEESRLPMLWGQGQNTELLRYYRELIKTRRNFPILGKGKALVIRADKNVFLYKKEESNQLFFALNLSSETQKVNVQHESIEILFKTGENDIRSGSSDITLPPLGGAIYSVY